MEQSTLPVVAGTMGALTRAHDWASTPVGPIESWPCSLRTAVSTVLCCQLPMYLAWGPEHTQFYNDAYIPILGPRHPAAMSESAPETWPEIWPTIGPMWADVLEGNAVGYDGFKLTIERFGYPEDRYFNFSYSPVPDDEGRRVGVLVTFVDTTDRVLAEERARFQLELTDGLRGLDDPDEITQWTCGVLGRHLDARRVGYALVRGPWIDVHLPGWHDGSVESIVGQSLPIDVFGPGIAADLQAGRTVRVDDVASDPRASAHPDVFARLKAPAMLIVPVMREAELIAVVAVGARAPRRWTDHEVGLVEDAAERTRSAVERAIAEQAQARADAFYRFVLDRTFAAVVVHDADGHIEFANPMASSFLGLTVDDLHGRPLTDPNWRFLHEDGTPLTLEEFPVSIVARTREPVKDYVFGISPSDGAPPAWVLVNAFPQFDDHGGLLRTVVSFVDITSRKLDESRLLEADRRKDEFLAMLAHELRNPLAPIGTAAQILKRSRFDPARIGDSADVIERQVGHLTSLVDDLLDVSRVTRGLVGIERETVDLRTVATAAVEQVQPLLQARQHELRTIMGAGDLFVDGDYNRLVQIATNLLTNAAKYTPQKGRIELEIGVDGSQAVIRVSDNGVGISPDLLPGIFDLFTQGERTPDRGQGGLGIGLALVRSLVGLHRGTVQAMSDGSNRGSTFIVRLPLASATVRTSPPLAPEPREANPRSIIVVDDNRDAASTLAELLRLLGHHVAIASDGASGLSLAATGDWDTFILDIGLPDMTGFALAEQLRSAPANSGAMFIALTGYGQTHDRVMSKAAGFDHHMVKPPDIAKLISILARPASAAAR